MIFLYVTNIQNVMCHLKPNLHSFLVSICHFRSKKEVLCRQICMYMI